MREIKFIWVCRNLHFNKIERVELTDTMLLSRSFPSWIISTNCELIAKILPTGLKDRQGKEIYEGDIVSHPLCIKEPHGVDEPCEHFIGSIVYEVNRGQWFAIGSPSQHSGYIVVMEEAYKFEVIGDIYRNPELLQEQK